MHLLHTVGVFEQLPAILHQRPVTTAAEYTVQMLVLNSCFHIQFWLLNGNISVLCK